MGSLVIVIVRDIDNLRVVKTSVVEQLLCRLNILGNSGDVGVVLGRIGVDKCGGGSCLTIVEGCDCVFVDQESKSLTDFLPKINLQDYLYEGIRNDSKHSK